MDGYCLRPRGCVIDSKRVRDAKAGELMPRLLTRRILVASVAGTRVSPTKSLLTTRSAHNHNMAQQQDSTLLNIREYVTKARELEDDTMDFDASSIEARLEDTVRELQARVREQQAALEKA